MLFRSPIRQRLKDYLTTTTLADLAASLKAKQSWRQLRLGLAPEAAVAAEGTNS